MKSFILMVIAMVCAVSLEAQSKSFYDFTVRTIDGKEFPLSSLKGKKVLVVNVASKCGLTPQYAKLQELQWWNWSMEKISRCLPCIMDGKMDELLEFRP